MCCTPPSMRRNVEDTDGMSLTLRMAAAHGPLFCDSCQQTAQLTGPPVVTRSTWLMVGHSQSIRPDDAVTATRNGVALPVCALIFAARRRLLLALEKVGLVSRCQTSMNELPLNVAVVPPMSMRQSATPCGSMMACTYVDNTWSPVVRTW